MHKNLDIEVDKVSKIEGHADLSVKVRNGRVKDVRLEVVENKRFYTQAVRGKPFNSVPQLVSRICGTCSIAHLTCCTEAVEKAIGFEPSAQTVQLRKLTYHGLMVRDHAMHLYLFCLPDILGVDSVLDLEKTHHDLLHEAFHVKGAGNNLCKRIAGRAVHATFSHVGGFLKLPTNDDIQKSIDELKSVREYVVRLVKIFDECDFEHRRNTNLVSLVSPDYSYFGGEIMSSEGTCINERFYYDHLHSVVIPYSQAIGFTFDGKPFMVGALARLNLNKDAIHPNTKKSVSWALNKFPSDNVYHNNLAQAIEVLHSLDSAIDILGKGGFAQEQRPALLPKEGTGVGVIEAPRGTLYYYMDLKKDGTVKFANLVTPSSQNQIMLEKDLGIIVQSNLHKKKSEIEHEMEKLIRAYDPCFSCASHFLKVKWI